MSLNLDFFGKKILVTGGTRGIGKEIALQFLINGGEVTITGTKLIDESKLKKDWGFKNVHFKRVDFLQKESVSTFLEWINNQEKIDILVNNAGINKIDKNIDSKTSDFENLIDVNLKGPYLFCREVSSIMKKNKYGKIVNISSIWGSITRSGRSLYSASKFGLVGLTKTLAVELAPHGILVNAVAPGFTMTELTKKTNSKEEIEDLKNTIPIKRLAEPIEIARVVLFITSEMNTYLTGQNIIIDGGYTNI
jgi:3-oxoacyl-[acyl-carrier protein] reductase